MELRQVVRRLPGTRWLYDNVAPSRRRAITQWRNVRSQVAFEIVQHGPFAGMKLTSEIPHLNKRVGSDEAELDQLVESWSAYKTILDVGCAHGWYAVGLALRISQAKVYAFDTDSKALETAARLARLNDVPVIFGGEQTAETLAEFVDGRTLILFDVEGAEVDLVDPVAAPRLRQADLLVETHDFARPGATRTIISRFPERRAVCFEPTRRFPQDYPALSGLSYDDAMLVLDERRLAGNRWVWLPAS